MDIKEMRRKAEVLSKILDVDKYIDECLISHYKNYKSKFIVNCDPKALPEEINLRIIALEVIQSKSNERQLIVTLNLKATK